MTLSGQGSLWIPTRYHLPLTIRTEVGDHKLVGTHISTTQSYLLRTYGVQYTTIQRTAATQCSFLPENGSSEHHLLVAHDLRLLENPIGKQAASFFYLTGLACAACQTGGQARTRRPALHPEPGRNRAWTVVVFCPFLLLYGTIIIRA
ncbi:hypothetical protein LZ31DRAFT_223758 [Colletotrichum somersetense]|nr:hypothetical protein LZ31DRAFT_223758 [Colletotrichum somersetense]